MQRTWADRWTSPAVRSAVFASLLVALLLGGCGKPRSGVDDRTDNVLRLSQRNEPTDLDPATASLPDEFFVIRALSEGLLVPNPDGGEPLPAAAERFDVSADRLTYTFHLRPNGRWSNGEAVTAPHFVASIRRALTPATAAPKADLFFMLKNARAFHGGTLADADALGARAVDERTLVLTLERPMSQFPRYVASGPWIPVHPPTVAKYGRRWTEPEHFVGNGPFTLAEWRPQQRIVVTRNPRYHDAASIALNGIQFIRFDNKDTEERAYRSGQIDVTMAVPESKLDTYARERPAELHRAPLAETRFLSFNTQRPPLNDPRVRRALSLALDRTRLVDFVLRGGQLPATRFLPPALAAVGGSRTSSVEGSHVHAPDEARRLLAAAGFRQGAGFPKLELSGWGNNPSLETLQQMWKQELGIEVRIVTHEAKIHLAALNAGTYDIAFVTSLFDVLDPLAALHDFRTGATNNFPHWASPEFDRRLAAAAQSLDERARREALEDAESLLLTEAPLAPLYFNVQNWLMSPRVTGWQQDPLWTRRYNDVRLK